MIPEDWDVSTVGAEFEVQLGKMLDAERNAGVLKPYIGNRSVQWNRIYVSELSMVRMSPIDVRRFRLREGDLLVCEGGEVGRSAVWHSPIDECYYQKALHRLRPRRGFDPKLMAELLHLWSAQGSFANHVTQTSIAHLPREKFLQVPMSVPTPPERKCITEALCDVQSAIDSIEKLAAKKRDLKQAAMQQLLAGQTRLPSFTDEWKLRSLSELFNFSGGYSASRDQLSADGYCYLHYGDIHGTTKTWIDTELDQSAIPRLDIPLSRISRASLLDDGDVVFVDASEDDEGTSKHLVVMNQLGIPFISGLHTIVAKSKTDELTHNYRRYCFQASDVREQFLFYAVGTKVSGISKKNIPKIVLTIPHADEQNAIAAVLSDMDAELATLEQRLAKTRALKQGMMQELLTGRIRLVHPEPTHA